MHFANYHDERKLLKATIDGQGRDNAIFVTGKPNYGKTWLLKWLEEEFAASARVLPMDLADPEFETTPLLAMNSWAGTLGWDFFGAYQDALARRPANQAKIQGVTVIGDNANVQAVAGPSLPDQLANAIELTASFIKGLAAAAAGGLPIIICIDGYCSGSQLARSWIERALVRHVANAGCGWLIIASREPAGEKLCEAGALLTITLGGVRETGEWTRIADELGRVLPGETPAEAQLQLKGAIAITDGEPGELMRWLQKQPARP